MQTAEGLEAFTMRLCTQILKRKAEEVQVLLAQVWKDLMNPRIHMLYDFVDFFCLAVKSHGVINSHVGKSSPLRELAIPHCMMEKPSSLRERQQVYTSCWKYRHCGRVSTSSLHV